MFSPCSLGFPLCSAGEPYAKLSLGVNECVNVCVHAALYWTGVPSKVYFCIVPGVPSTGFNHDEDKAVSEDEW